MTDIRIKQLRLENFKCHKALTLELDGKNTTLYGDNATGKTSIYDGFVWLLFGKDSLGNGEKNIEIKPLDAEGNVKDHHAVTAVEAALLVNGGEVVLRRTYREVWTTKRGSSEATYDGNTSEYYVDGVPCQKNAFQKRVSELVDEDTFRMLTNVSHFASGISWQERRGVLFQVAGVMDDKQILATNEAFQPLAEGMGRLSLGDYKKKLLGEKRQFVGAKTDIPARISECEKTIEDIADLDFAAAKAAVEGLSARKEDVSAKLLAIEHDNAAEQKSLEIQRQQLALDALEKENKLHRDAQLMGGVDVHSLNVRLTSLGMQIEGKKRSIANEERYISGLEKQIAESRTRWVSVNSETFAGENCPTCGQALLGEQYRASMERFELAKKGRLAEIEATASSNKAAKEQAEDRLVNVKSELQQMEVECETIRAKITAAEAAKVEPKDMADYASRRQVILAQIDKLNSELDAIHHSVASVKSGLRQEMTEINEQIETQMAVISKESLLDYSRERIGKLRRDAQNAAECLNAIESMLYLIDEYSRYKTRFVEDSVNALFKLARFRLFREQANGGVEERCDVVYDGVPYSSVNNGMRINLGVDIINTLSRAYGVTVPLFVDNAESVTRLETADMQVIRLAVSETDKELRVNYEN